MKVVHGDLFNYPAQVICITTNGCVNRNGEAIMGKGCAAQAVALYPGIKKALGDKLVRFGNITQVLTVGHGKIVVSFPTKPTYVINDGTNVISYKQEAFYLNDKVPGYWAKSDINIIKESAERLVQIADRHNWRDILVPMPGCSCGELTWAEVRSVLEPIFDDRFVIITNDPRLTDCSRS